MIISRIFKALQLRLRQIGKSESVPRTVSEPCERQNCRRDIFVRRKAHNCYGTRLQTCFNCLMGETLAGDAEFQEFDL